MGGRTSWVLGLSCSHNGAACLLRDDELVVAIQEERLTRVKRAYLEPHGPSRAVARCLEVAGIGAGALALIVYSCNRARVGLAIPELELDRHETPVLAMGHHQAHAWAAFATSGFEEAAVLVIDGAGSPVADLGPEERAAVRGAPGPGREWLSIYAASPAGLRPLEKQVLPGEAWLTSGAGPGMRRFHSLGGMFAAVAEQVFDSRWEAGKVMGLAPCGRATLPVSDFFAADPDGVLRFGEAVPARFPGADRWPARREEYQDLAASTQRALEDALAAIVARAAARAGSRNLCYAGGVALNAVANEQVLFAPGAPFDEVYVMPAAEDSGPALGAAWFGRHRLAGPRPPRRLTRDALGPTYGPEVVRAAIAAAGPGLRVLEAPDPIATTVDLLCAGRVVGWFHGGSELGPRALGQRSILLDPRLAAGKDLLNARVKRREAFRPFAPAVLLEEVPRWFAPHPRPESPFMLRVRPFLPGMGERVPAVVHVDGTGRLQTLAPGDGPLRALVEAFFARTGVPMLLNTSFNVAGEPIVETPADALRCLLATGIDCCVLEGVVVAKE